MVTEPLPHLSNNLATCDSIEKFCRLLWNVGHVQSQIKLNSLIIPAAEGYL